MYPQKREFFIYYFSTGWRRAERKVLCVSKKKLIACDERGKTEAMEPLAQKKCLPCKGGVPPLKGGALDKIQKELGNGWQVIDEHHLEKEFKFKNFTEALGFTNKVGALAEQVGHHPDIYLAWGNVKVTIWTHKIDGLTETDFIFAAKVDKLLSSPLSPPYKGGES